VGVDFAEASIEYLSQKYSNQRPKFLHSDISSNNLPHRLNKQFDIIIAFDVFYHIAEDELLEKAMDNLDRVLVPYGWLIFTDVLQIQEEKTGKYQSHVKWRSRDHWISILSKRGFDVKTEIPMFVFLHSAITGSPVLRRCVNMFHYKITPHLSELPWIGQIYLSVLSRCDDFLTKYTGTSLYIAFAQKGGK
jgi:SAM-dependent methyltransferase